MVRCRSLRDFETHRGLSLYAFRRVKAPRNFERQFNLTNGHHHRPVLIKINPSPRGRRRRSWSTHIGLYIYMHNYYCVESIVYCGRYNWLSKENAIIQCVPAAHCRYRRKTPSSPIDLRPSSFFRVHYPSLYIQPSSGLIKTRVGMFIYLSIYFFLKPIKCTTTIKKKIKNWSNRGRTRAPRVPYYLCVRKLLTIIILLV